MTVLLLPSTQTGCRKKRGVDLWMYYGEKK
jgi:hypothetical protein